MATFRRTRGSIAPHRTHGVLARRPDGALRKPQTIPSGVGSGGRFAAYIPLYASCNPTLIGDTDVSGVPIRMFHGSADDYVPVAPCRAYVERLRAAGNDVRLTEFADAHHAYDNPLGGRTAVVATNAQSVRACKLKEEAPGTIINAETGQPFSYGDPASRSIPTPATTRRPHWRPRWRSRTCCGRSSN